MGDWNAVLLSALTFECTHHVVTETTEEPTLKTRATSAFLQSRPALTSLGDPNHRPHTFRPTMSGGTATSSRIDDILTTTPLKAEVIVGSPRVLSDHVPRLSTLRGLISSFPVTLSRKQRNLLADVSTSAKQPNSRH
eukprot:283517-Chlamydomonas_euryale.AAC.1